MKNLPAILVIINASVVLLFIGWAAASVGATFVQWVTTPVGASLLIGVAMLVLGVDEVIGHLKNKVRQQRDSQQY